MIIDPSSATSMAILLMLITGGISLVMLALWCFGEWVYRKLK